MAYLVLQPGTDGVIDELRSLLQARLPHYMQPAHYLTLDALPLTPSQKIARGELKALAQALPGQADCIDTRHLKKRVAG